MYKYVGSALPECSFPLFASLVRLPSAVRRPQSAAYRPPSAVASTVVVAPLVSTPSSSFPSSFVPTLHLLTILLDLPTTYQEPRSSNFFFHKW